MLFCSELGAAPFSPNWYVRSNKRGSGASSGTASFFSLLYWVKRAWNESTSFRLETFFARYRWWKVNADEPSALLTSFFSLDYAFNVSRATPYPIFSQRPRSDFTVFAPGKR
jgi:hypothetical protein